MANRFQFLEFVRPGEEILAALEQLALEVRSQAEAQHRDAQFVHDLGQLVHLLPGQELRLVDENAVNAPLFQFGGRHVEEVVVAAEGQGAGLEADARADQAALVAIVQGGREQQRRHAPFTIVVRRLQQGRRFACVHRRVVKIELCHVESECRRWRHLRVLRACRLILSDPARH